MVRYDGQLHVDGATYGFVDNGDSIDVYGPDGLVGSSWLDEAKEYWIFPGEWPALRHVNHFEERDEIAEYFIANSQTV